MNEQTNRPSAAPSAADARRFRPKLSLYHANAKGTGGALKLELHPAHDATDGSIMAASACVTWARPISRPSEVA